MIRKRKLFCLYILTICLFYSSCNKHEVIANVDPKEDSIDMAECYIGQIHFFDLDSINESNVDLKNMLDNHVYIPIKGRPENEELSKTVIQVVVVPKEEFLQKRYTEKDTVIFKIQEVKRAFPSDIHNGLFPYQDTIFLCSITICCINKSQKE